MHQTAEASIKLKLVPEPRDSGRAAEALQGLLDRVRSLCEESGEGLSNFRPRVVELQERLAAERFHLAVLGQFKRGKSTLLNAVLGEPLLPTGVVPLTSIPTFLRAGKTRGVRIVFLDGRQSDSSDLTLAQASEVLARHVTEKENPKNQLGVETVEVEHPCALLTDGVVLIDTPGIGSTLRHNTEATLHFLSQCDAALFVVSADPPITDVEKDFLKRVQGKVAKLCFVMNKIDYLSQSELAEAVNFFENVLKELAIQDAGPIFNVSARRGIEARLKEDPERWHESGLEELQNYLVEFLSGEKSRTLQMAISKKAVDVVADAAMNIDVQQRALELSREEAERRVRIFNDKVKVIEGESVRMADLLAGDKKRAVQFLEDLAESLRADSLRHLGQLVGSLFKSNESLGSIERQAKERLAEEVPLFFTGKLAGFSAEMNRRLEAAIAPYQERLDALIGTLRSTAAELFEVPYRAPASRGAFETRCKPYWVTQKWNTSISPVPEGFADRILPTELRKRRLEKRLSEEVETLVMRNVENIRWATLRNLDEAFRRCSNAINERLKETADATRSAIRAGQLRRAQNDNLADPELERLGQRAKALAELEETLAHYANS